ncbi:NAD(P)H-binding protein [Streptomyces sp. NPDC012600]|uniref:NAD(P)H-binding protein n=1 Tax=Streptomyces sp. NPDC012600 TaxID=3415005 RepID=UPI003C2EB7C6
MRILVTGATGGVGRHVVDQLISAGVQVRALTRDPAKASLPPEAEVVRGDLTAPDELAAAFEGVDRLHLFPVEETAREVVALAAKSGVGRIVDLSAAAITIGLYESPTEQAIEESGLEWTHVRPAEFMTNRLHLWGPDIRARRVVRYPFPDETGVPVHEADIAAVSVAALLEDRFVGKALTLTGPARISAREQAAAIGDALGEEVRFEEVSREEALRLMKAQGGFAAENAEFLLGYQDYSGEDGGGEDGLSEQDYSELTRPWPDVEEATGRPALDFARWAKDRVDDFR